MSHLTAHRTILLGRRQISPTLQIQMLTAMIPVIKMKRIMVSVAVAVAMNQLKLKLVTHNSQSQLFWLPRKWLSFWQDVTMASNQPMGFKISPEYPQIPSLPSLPIRACSDVNNPQFRCDIVASSVTVVSKMGK